MSADLPDDLPLRSPDQRRLPPGLVREIIALLLVLAGAVGVTFVAYLYAWELAVATISVIAIITGLYLANER